MIREDLLAITQKQLTELTNLGLFKRAQKEVLQQTEATLEIDDLKNLIVRFTDGIVTIIPKDGLFLKSTCSCNAQKDCRHRISAILLYQNKMADNNKSIEVDKKIFDAKQIDDLALQKILGENEFSHAILKKNEGYIVEVHFKESTFLLHFKTCSISIRYQLNDHDCSCKLAKNCQHLALAIWALQTRNFEDTFQTMTIEINRVNKHEVLKDETFEVVSGLIDLLIENGVNRVATSLKVKFEIAKSMLLQKKYYWLIDSIEDLEKIILHYQHRTVFFDHQRLQSVMIDLYARVLYCQTNLLELPIAPILGQDESYEEKLSKLQLIGLGCHVEKYANYVHVQIIFFDPIMKRFFVWQKDYDYEDSKHFNVRELCKRFAIASAAIHTCATGVVTSQVAICTANKEVKFSNQKFASTSVFKFGFKLQQVPADRCIENVSQFIAEVDKKLPFFLLPRYLFQSIYVVPVKELLRIAFDPSEQVLKAEFINNKDESIDVVCKNQEFVSDYLILASALLKDQNIQAIIGNVEIVSGKLTISPISIYTDKLMCLTSTAATANQVEEFNKLPFFDSQSDISVNLKVLRPLLNWMDRVLLLGIFHDIPRDINCLSDILTNFRGLGLHHLTSILAQMIQNLKLLHVKSCDIEKQKYLSDFKLLLIRVKMLRLT